MTDAEQIAAGLSEAMAHEQLVMAALTYAYQKGYMHHLHYSQGYDATIARMAAISFAEEDPVAVRKALKETDHAV